MRNAECRICCGVHECNVYFPNIPLVLFFLVLVQVRAAMPPAFGSRDRPWLQPPFLYYRSSFVYFLFFFAFFADINTRTCFLPLSFHSPSQSALIAPATPCSKRAVCRSHPCPFLVAQLRIPPPQLVDVRRLAVHVLDGRTVDLDV